MLRLTLPPSPPFSMSWFGLGSAPAEAIPTVRRLRVALSEERLIHLCREAAHLDEGLLLYLLPYLPFRVAKRRLPVEALVAFAWLTRSDAELPADLATAMAAWDRALGARDERGALLGQLRVAGLLRIAGVPEGELLWRSESIADGYDLAAAAIYALPSSY